MSLFFADSMVLESFKGIRSSRSSKVPSICHRYFESAFTRFRRPRRHEWCSKVPNSQGWSVYWSLTVRPYLVSHIFI